MTHPSFLTASLYVITGGGIGAWLRFVAGRLFTAGLGPVRAGNFPWATLTVNMLGSLAMGLLVGWLAGHGSHGEGTRLFVAVGLLGGFTTFSSFSLEMVLLIQRGQPGLAAIYAAASVIAGLTGLLAGLAIIRSVA